MNIQRKYSLPNCTLVLEGLNDTAKANNFQEVRPPLSILVNAECHLSGVNQPLTGGREFFESLVRAVSAYAQEFLSNVSNPQAHNTESELVQLEKVDTNQHQLIVHSQMDVEDNQSSRDGHESALKVNLNTVQLFDLVEAVDQFFADSQTLPELSLELQPVSKRYGGAAQALIKQAVPAGVGVTSLAAAAVAFGMLPIPEYRPTPQTQSKQPAVEASASPSENQTPTSTSKQTNTTPTATNPDTATNNNTSTPVKDLEALLKQVPEINNSSQLKALNRQVYNQINSKWINREVKQDLVYRVGVAADGAIVGYKAVNKEANKQVETTPLSQLLYNSADQKPITNEPIAQFRVVFRRENKEQQKQVLEVSPWNGYPKTPDVFGARITDANQVKELRQKLYDNIRENWGGTPTYKQVLKYRVAVKKDGIIADYEPLNKSAFDNFRETPLPKMFLAIYGSNVAAPNSKEPLAHYQVEFSPSGNLDVKPWQGYR
ncbi:MAG: DUF4335 domain-containing protein [Calothrix sp. MO_167.B42]|nr:DUF4335 domain-containing protein [Calothrix sp. MO_167.B42]